MEYLIEIDYKGQLSNTFRELDEKSEYGLLIKELLVEKSLTLNLSNLDKKLLFSIAVTIRGLTNDLAHQAFLEVSKLDSGKVDLRAFRTLTTIICYNGVIFLVNDDLNLFSNKMKDIKPFLAKQEDIVSGGIFYSSSQPADKPGKVIKEHAISGIFSYQDKYSKGIDFSLKFIKKKHRTNYLKWSLSNDMSIRYFITFEDDRAKEGNFFMKSHNDKLYISLSSDEAEKLIQELAREKAIGIMGWLNTQSQYKKIIYDPEESGYVDLT